MQGSEDALKLADPAPPYAHALEEVADHARLLALRVERAVARFRESRNVVEAPGLQTLAIFDSEVDEILRNLDPSRDADGFDELIERQLELIQTRTQKTSAPCPIATAERHRCFGKRYSTRSSIVPHLATP